VTTPALTVQTLKALLVTDVTPSPFVDTTGVNDPPKGAAPGRFEIYGLVGVAWTTLKDCCACGAGAHNAFPDWLASTSQVPIPIMVKTPAFTEQTLVALGSTESVTPIPDVAEVAGW
jgi:hypothetical protein